MARISNLDRDAITFAYRRDRDGPGLLTQRVDGIRDQIVQNLAQHLGISCHFSDVLIQMHLEFSLGIRALNSDLRALLHQRVYVDEDATGLSLPSQIQKAARDLLATQRLPDDLAEIIIPLSGFSEFFCRLAVIDVA